MSGSADEHEAVPVFGNNDDSSEDEMLGHFLFNVCRSYIHNRPQRIRQLTSRLTGNDWMAELINGADTAFYNALRMKKLCFMALVDELTTRGLLTNGPQARLSIEEKVAILLRTITHQSRHRIPGERFQHSTETVNRAVHQVLKAFMGLASLHITPPDYVNTPPKVLNDPSFYPYFKDVIGAMDGSLIPAWVSEDQQLRYRSRKGTLSQNVLAICDFEGLFTYVYAGWEGSASDARVLSSAILNDDHFPWPPKGKMYLVDAGFCNYDCFLAPYRSTRYHLQEFRNTGVHPSTPHELFNLRHSQLRNVVERCFGMLKSRFPVLRYGLPSYAMRTQVKMVIACCVLHNFIRKLGMPDPIFDGPQVGNNADPTLHSNARNATRQSIDNQSECRDAIADVMWQNREGH